MSDDTATTDTTTDDGDKGPQALRDALARSQEETKEAKNQLAQKDAALKMAAFEIAGLDPTDENLTPAERGLAKAIFQTYEGATSPKEILAYAKDEYGFEPDAQNRNPVSEEQRRVTEVVTDSADATPKGLGDQIQQAEKDGNWERASILKAEALTRIATKRQTQGLEF